MHFIYVVLNFWLNKSNFTVDWWIVTVCCATFYFAANATIVHSTVSAIDNAVSISLTIYLWWFVMRTAFGGGNALRYTTTGMWFNVKYSNTFIILTIIRACLWIGACLIARFLNDQ